MDRAPIIRIQASRAGPIPNGASCTGRQSHTRGTNHSTCADQSQSRHIASNPRCFTNYWRPDLMRELQIERLVSLCKKHAQSRFNRGAWPNQRKGEPMPQRAKPKLKLAPRPRQPRYAPTGKLFIAQTIDGANLVPSSSCPTSHGASTRSTSPPYARHTSADTQAPP